MNRKMLSGDGAGDMLPRRRPMDLHSIAPYLRWIAPEALLVYLATRMLRNRLVAEMPVFFSYVLFAIAKFLVRFTVYHVSGYRSYFAVYWSFSFVDAIFVLAVIHELYVLVFRPYQGLTLFVSALFKWCAAILVLVAAVTAGAATGTELTRYVAGIMILDQSATIVQLGLLTLLFIATSSLWVVWQRSLFGIAIGLAIVLSIDLMSLALTMRYGTSFSYSYNWVKSLAYLCGVLVWTIFVLRREERVSFTMRDDLQLQEWNAALLRLLGR